MQWGKEVREMKWVSIEQQKTAKYSWQVYLSLQVRGIRLQFHEIRVALQKYVNIHVSSEVIHELGKGDSLHWEDSDGMKDRWQHCLLVKNIMITPSVSYWVVSWTYMSVMRTHLSSFIQNPSDIKKHWLFRVGRRTEAQWLLFFKGEFERNGWNSY